MSKKTLHSTLVASVILVGSTSIVSTPAASAEAVFRNNFPLPAGFAIKVPQLNSPATGASTGAKPVQYAGAPTPTPFSPAYIAGYISDVSSYNCGIYAQVNQQFPDIRDNHPEVMEANLDTVVDINRHASAKRVKEAQQDAVAIKSNLLANLSPALGNEFGKAVRDALAENRLPKTEYLLGNGFAARAGGVASSTAAEKYLFNYERPFKVAPDRIRRYEIPDESLYGNSPSFPSGHTNQSTWVTSILAYMVPEVAPQLHYRGAVAGNSRIVLGVHYPLDVIGGRMSGQAAAADRLNDPKMRDAIDQAAKELRAEVEWRTKKSIPELVASDEALLPTKDAVSQYEEWMYYDLPKIRNENADMIVPPTAPNLIASSFPELTYAQRAEVLRRTAGPAGAPLDWQGEGGSWQRLNLAAASAAKVSVNADGSLDIQ